MHHVLKLAVILSLFTAGMASANTGTSCNNQSSADRYASTNPKKDKAAKGVETKTSVRAAKGTK